MRNAPHVTLLKDVVQNIITDVLQRHIAAATEEVASAIADEIELRATDRVADLRAQLELQLEWGDRA